MVARIRFTPTKITREHTQVLKTIQGLGHTSAIIAGGAVRDSYFSKPISDIDIFIHDPEYAGNNVSQLTSFDIGRHLLSSDQPQTTFYDDDCDDYVDELFDTRWGSPGGGATNRFVSQIINLQKDGILYQIISLKVDPVEYVKKHFDVGLCMAWCDGTRLRFTQRFQTDAANKTITLCGDLTEQEYDYAVRNHIPRIKQKYPNFTVEVEPHLHKFARVC